MANVQQLTPDQVQAELDKVDQLDLPDVNPSNVGAIVFIGAAAAVQPLPQVAAAGPVIQQPTTQYNANTDLTKLIKPTDLGIEIASSVVVSDVDVSGSVTVNPGYGIVNVVSDQKIYHAKITSNVIYFGGVNYLKNNHYKNDKLQLKCVAHPIPKTQYLGYYGFYLKKIITSIKNVNKMLVENVPADPTIEYLPVYIGGTDRDARIICGCCGIYLTTDTMIAAHISKKMTMFTAWAKNKFNNCPICEVEFENNPDCVMHWYDSNHTTVATRSIIGETIPSVNDMRLQKGFGLPYTAVVQAMLSVYLPYAGVVSLFLAHKATTVEIANTSELASSLAVELIMARDTWQPDCPYCDDRFFFFNTVHYRSCLSLVGNVTFTKAKCGHMIPNATADQVDLLHFPWFRYLAKKMRGEVIPGSCTGYKTMSRFDDYDDGSDDLNWRNYFFVTVQMSMASEVNNSSSDGFMTHTFSPPVHKTSFVMENYSRVGFMNPIFFPVTYHHLLQEIKAPIRKAEPCVVITPLQILTNVHIPAAVTPAALPPIKVPATVSGKHKGKENVNNYKNKKNKIAKTPKGRTDVFYDHNTKQYRCTTDFGLSIAQRVDKIQQLSQYVDVVT